mmetsp:Transcript_12621/g.26983  ORF Transcript_12621/g.26983 Transcript_12621/m.26983 type:complete len:98 (+) Transcript_12621:556-849(+)
MAATAAAEHGCNGAIVGAGMETETIATRRGRNSRATRALPDSQRRGEDNAAERPRGVGRQLADELLVRAELEAKAGLAATLLTKAVKTAMMRRKGCR